MINDVRVFQSNKKILVVKWFNIQCVEYVSVQFTINISETYQQVLQKQNAAINI